MGSRARAPAFATLQVHAGQNVDSIAMLRGCSENNPITINSTHTSNSFSLKRNTNADTQLLNIAELFEDRMAALEGGVAAIATASGQAAQLVAILALAHSGMNIIASTNMYGGTWNRFAVTLKNLGIEVRFVSTVDPAEYAAAIDENTRAIYIESIANPKFVFHSINDLAMVAHNAGIPLVVDNTLGMGGYIIRPIEHGADIVVESATKWICGHGVALGGVVVDSGNFNWRHSGKFPALTTARYGRGAFVDVFGRKAFSAKIREDIQHDFGTTIGLFSAILMLQGLETLSLRADRHCMNAHALAKWLEKEAKVSWVSYLGLETHESHALASAYLKRGLYGGVLTFAIKGGSAAADKVLHSLRLASHLANLGDTRTLVIRPVRTTQGRTLNDSHNDSATIDAMIRVSVGIEAIDDIITDFRNALDLIDVE
ncbi:O-acetylhomoserine (thiol)-lyase [Termitomyces sp. T112]|nr:O-acetylhomoserine (thiol)-lyase [Termitomyces sp. T112]